MDRDTMEFLAQLEREQEALPSNDAIVPSGERECPICKERMRVEIEYGPPLGNSVLP